MITCRCSNKKISELKYGSDCSNNKCVYVFSPQEVKTIYDDVSTREVSEEEVEKFKNEINHQETNDLDDIGNCSSDNYCMRYFDTSGWSFGDYGHG